MGDVKIKKILFILVYYRLCNRSQNMFCVHNFTFIQYFSIKLYFSEMSEVYPSWGVNRTFVILYFWGSPNCNSIKSLLVFKVNTAVFKGSP